MTKKKKKLIIILSSVAAVLILIIFLIAPFTISAIIYDGVFGERFETNDNYRLYLDDFDGLQADRYEFKSDNGQTLIGYRYYINNEKPCGVVVIAHGFGDGGHNSYMDVAYYFAQNNYNVFAYDATGNDESSGDCVKGLPQGVIDLGYAIDFVKEIDELKKLPIMLFGHSWGGYSVCNVLNFHPEIKAVVSVSGFNKSSDLIRAQGTEMVGGIVDAFMPYVNSIENMRFGKYAKTTAMSGFEKSQAGIFIVHSQDDTVVPIKYGYDIYYSKYADNARFKFLKYEDKRHNTILYSYEGINYLDEFINTADEYFNGKNLTKEEISDYFKNNLDRKIYCNMLDKELMRSIVEFYNSYLKIKSS